MTGTWVVVAPVGARAEVYGPYAKIGAEKGALRLERAGFVAFPVELRTVGDLGRLAHHGPPA